MNSREAFEAWFAASNWNKYDKDTAEDAWQAAIQHASDVAVKACEEIHDDYFRQARQGDKTGKSDARADAADDCADAIKEALK